MEKFKQRMRARNIYLMTAAALLVVVFVVLRFYSNLPAPNTELTQGFQDGLAGALEGLLICLLIKNLLAMRSEDKLQQLYIKENDERSALILQKTGRTLLPVCAVCFGVASVVALYYSMDVFYTLLGVLTFMAAVKVTIRIYYSRKY